MTNVLDLIAYRDGEYKPLREIGPSILDFGFIHCDSTYDVMPVYNGKAFCYDRHSTRFENSAKRSGLGCFIFTLNQFMRGRNLMNLTFVVKYLM